MFWNVSHKANGNIWEWNFWTILNLSVMRKGIMYNFLQNLLLYLFQYRSIWDRNGGFLLTVPSRFNLLYEMLFT